MSLTILQWNIKGYINNFNELQILIKKYRPGIISLQETHIQNTTNLIIPISYRLYLTTSTHNSYGGSALLIHNSIQHEELDSQSNFDSIALHIHSKKSFILFSTYIPPNKSFVYNDLAQLFDTRSPMLITGDFNSWHVNWGSGSNNKRGRILNKYITRSRLIILNDGSPTHFSTHGSFTNVDLTMASASLAMYAEWKTESDLSGSDHYPIITSLFPNSVDGPSPSMRPTFNLKKANWIDFCKLSEKYSDERQISPNINKEAANLHRIILQSANESIPVHKPKLRGRTVPWWSKTLEQLKTKRNHLWNKFKRNITTENELNYRRANALYKREIKLSKSDSINRFTSEINPSTSSEKIWTNIRVFCGLKPRNPIHCIQDPDDLQNRITDYRSIADTFCKYWSSESRDENFSVTFQQCKQSAIINTRRITPAGNASLIEERINNIEFSIAINKLKGTTPGLDRISYPMIKNLSQKVRERLVSLYNCILDGYVPQSYKTSMIIPVLKPNSDKTNICSYRPISLNSCCSKVLDKIIANRLWWFVSTNKLINSHQYGFVKGKSIADPLMYIDFKITQALRSKSHLSIISLDFAKAFDKIGIHTILDQLEEWKIGPKIYNYIRNYLTCRKIIVRNKSFFSKTFSLSNGIPQGSPLSVILFLIAYNKLSNIISMHKELDFIAYADDYVILKKMNRKKNQNIDLNHFISDIQNWCNTSGANLSLSKCKHLHICRKRNCSPTLHSNNTPIESNSKLKILGIVFNNRYRWNSHIDYINVNLSKRLNVIKCLSSRKFGCNTASLIHILKAIIVSKINYGIYLYGFSPKSMLNKIKTIFNSAIRFSLGAFRTTPIRNMIFEADVMSIEQYRDFATAKLFKSIILSDRFPLSNLLRKALHLKTFFDIPSTLTRVVEFCHEFNIPFNISLRSLKGNPNWKLDLATIDTSLNDMRKHSTNPEIYRQRFIELQNRFVDHKFIYTDGSRSDKGVGYSIVSVDSTLMLSILPEYSTNFSAEIIAIYESVKKIRHTRGKFAICTDSLSALDSIKNLNNDQMYPNMIRQIIIERQPHIRLIWIPGHCGITGNEIADESAKAAISAPMITTMNLAQNDIKNFIKSKFAERKQENFTLTNRWYKNSNTNKLNAVKIFRNIDQNICPRGDQIKITRLRLGHTRISHAHLINSNLSSQCPFCGLSPNTIGHLFSNCPHINQYRNSILRDANLFELINVNMTNENIKTIIEFLKKSNLYNSI